MNKHTSSYPEFLSAVSGGRVCFVFGAGASKSLSSEAVGWLDWLQSGVSMLEGHGELKLVMKGESVGDAGANELIKLAGEVIAAAKEEGVYEKWMTEYVANPKVENLELSRVLRKIPAVHDFIATTNYDLLLEQATGLGTTSWSNPGEAFQMIDRGSSDMVIHLHGVFDPKSRLDDIVADGYQYSALYNDEGAQFVQHLIGVRPIVFVGCGATVEDPNISRLLRFVAEKLEVDVPHFFLCRSGEVMPELPANVQPVEYGSEYGDLMPFLDELLSGKATCISQASPMVGRVVSWMGEEGTQKRALGLDAYHFANDRVPFFGREVQMATLRAMLTSSGSFAWLCITGQGGSGKSRAAYELLKSSYCEWVGFFLLEQATRGDAAAFEPLGDTLVVIDYVLGREAKVAGIVQALHARFVQTGYRLRIILIERDSDRGQFSWFGKLRAAMGGFFASTFENAEFGDGIDLRYLDDGSVAEIIAETCRQCGLPPDSRRDAMLREDYRKNFETLAFRPLFVRMFMQAWIKNGRTKPLYSAFTGVLEEELQREQGKWLALFDGDQHACNSMLRLIVRACAGGPLRFVDLPDEYAADWNAVKRFAENHTFPGTQRDKLLDALVSLSCHDISDPSSVIAPSFPCVIREYMIVYYIPEGGREEFAGELWRNASKEFSQVLARGC